MLDLDGHSANKVLFKISIAFVQIPKLRYDTGASIKIFGYPALVHSVQGSQTIT